ncbi:MAG TPA: 30S ribosomal protein S6 [Candidatus Paceibacterota bacterium]|nr:30S ribosomal protein S6 [Candidatus Paceibacterota bacterium]
MTETRRNYELAFHINPNLDESKIAQISNELKDILTKHDATVTFTHEPERKRLSYPINGNEQSYFGFIQFSTENTDRSDDGRQSPLTSVDDYIKLHQDVIRAMTIRLPSDAKKSQALARQQKARERQEKQAKAAAKAEAEKPAQDSGKLDEELEDIIEKL